MTPELLQHIQAARKAQVAACLISRADSGAQRVVRGEDIDDLPPELAEITSQALRSDKLQEAELDGVTWYAAPYNPPVRIAIIGAVHIAQALLPMAQPLGFQTKIIDPRGAFASTVRFEDADIDTAWPDEALDAMDINARTAIVTLTHDPKLDDPALDRALKSNAFYIGALGSRRTHAKRVDRLQQQGFSEDQIGRIHAPVGLNIGAQSPQEIALSILGQIVQQLRQP